MRRGPLSRLLVLLVLCVGVAAGLGAALQDEAPDPAQVAGYEVGRPVASMTLSDQLREISGVVAIGPDRLAALQDEKGSIFVIDWTRRQEHRIKFGPRGDYEALACDGRRFWVLRSDGVVMRLSMADDRFVVDDERELTAPQKEFEGMCWDPVGRALLVAPKSLLPDKDDKDERPIYVVDPDTLEQRKRPLVTIDLDDVRAAAVRDGVALPTKTNKRGVERVLLKLRFSAVAVHPRTGDLWLLSAVDGLLLVVTRDGAIRGVHLFPARLLPKPEGLTFLPDGDLVVGSEGEPGVLRRFRAVE